MGVINQILANATSPAPVIGMGATMYVGSDRHAYSVVEVPKPTTVVVKRDTTRPLHANPFSEAQRYEYSPNPDATAETFTLRKGGVWVREGESLRHGTRISLGTRSEYYDPSF